MCMRLLCLENNEIFTRLSASIENVVKKFYHWIKLWMVSRSLLKNFILLAFDDGGDAGGGSLGD